MHQIYKILEKWSEEEDTRKKTERRHLLKKKKKAPGKKKQKKQRECVKDPDKSKERTHSGNVVVIGR